MPLVETAYGSASYAVTGATVTDAYPYLGRTTRADDVIEVHATHLALWDWANRSGASWPCSALARYDEVTARFDSNGLYELSVKAHGGFDDPADDLSSDELSAWSSDVLTLANLPTDHPAYHVTVGQFQTDTDPPRDDSPYNRPHLHGTGDMGGTLGMPV